MQLKQELVQQIRSIISTAKDGAIRSVDTERVLMYWQIGKVILEEEQEGKERAGYGEFLIKSLSETLQPQFGSGFSIRQLEMCRQFYRVFPITNALRSQFNEAKNYFKYRLISFSTSRFLMVSLLSYSFLPLPNPISIFTKFFSLKNTFKGMMV